MITGGEEGWVFGLVFDIKQKPLVWERPGAKVDGSVDGRNR